MAYRSITIGAGASDTWSPTKPSGVVDGDILTVAVATTETVSIFKSDGTTSAGFSALANATTDGDRSRVGAVKSFTKVASSEPASYVINIGGGNGFTFRAAIVAHSGRSGIGVATATNDAGSSASPTSIPLTGVTAVAGDDILVINDIEDTNTTGTYIVASTPASYTDRGSIANNGTFVAGLLDICTRDNVSAGATGTLTSSGSMSGGQGESCGIVIRIPAAAGGASSKLLSQLANQGGF